ncbi:dcap-1, partial [Pristionchus pacificus]
SRMTTRKADPINEAKNLMIIQRIDICAEAILDKATHTALYKFNTSARAWEKTEIDGAMFIYKRADHPIYSLMIANRQSPEDLIEPILPKIKVKMDKPYLFFCKVDGSIQGLWFFDTHDLERIYNLITKIIFELRQEARITPPPKAVMDNTSTGSNGFLNMLMSGGATITSSTKHQPSPLSPSIPTLTKNSTQSAQVKPVKPSAQLPAQQTSYVKPQQQQQQQQQSAPVLPPPPAVPSMLQKLMSEQLPPSLGSASNVNGPIMSAADLERDLVRQSRVSELQLQGMNPSASAASLAAYSNQSVHGSDAGDIAELESMAGALSIGIDTGDGGTRGPLSPTGSNRTTHGLDKHQLAMGLVQLLQTDDEFLAKVHQAYVEALNRRIGA